MSLSEDLAYVGTVELAGRIRRRELSPVEVVEATIARIEARDGTLGAFTYRGFDDARARAKQAEAEVMAGAPLGPLHGVPVAIKDLFDAKPGWVSTWGGIPALKDNVTSYATPFTESMERAGAIIVGMTNSPVMGFRGTCDNYLFGPTGTPFDVSKNSGGSSGGSAAAVADGMVSLAQGSDGGGSIRIPAAFCGAFGYKAAFGRVPCVIRPEGFAGSTTPFIFNGPITRSVADGALAMEVLAQYDPRDPYCLDDKVDFQGAMTRSIKGWKIAYSPDFDVFPVDPAVAQVVRAAVSVFEEAGARVEEVKLGLTRSQQELSELWCRLIMAGNQFTLALAKQRGLDLVKDHADNLPPEYLRWVDGSFQPSAQDVLQDQIIRTEVYDAVQGVFADYDLLLTPTLACLPPDNATDGNTVGPSRINGEAVNPLLGWCLTYPLNFTGHPAASIPAGLSGGLSGGLPVGLQIIGKRYGDSDVFAASAAFEQLRPWQAHYEICAKRPL